MLAVRGLRIAYPTPDGEVREVVHGVDLDLRRGEIHALVGESGSGKSQIAFSTFGILPAEALILGGSVLLDGEDLLADPARMRQARGRRIGYIPQEPMSNLDPSFTVGKQLAYGLKAATSLSDKDIRQRIVDLLTRVGITDPERVMGLYPHEISGGMAQRVLICGAVAADPDIIVADEPTTALDVTVQAEVLELLRELSDERGLAMLLVTHNLGVVADLCDTVSVMKDGNIVERAAVDQIFESPQQEYTRELLQSSRRVELYGGIVTDPATPAPRALTRSSQVNDLEVTFPGRRGKQTRVINGVSFDLAAGETLSLVGESGSGKTTIGRAILGLAPVTGGAITFRGETISNISRKRRRKLATDIQVVFQDPYSSLNPSMTIESILVEPLQAAGVEGGTHAGPGAARRRRAPQGCQQSLPARVLRRPAPAGRDRPGAGDESSGDRLRRADKRAGRHHPGPRPDLVQGAAGGDRRGLPVHQPRPRRRQRHQRPHRGALPRRDRRDR